MSLYAVKSVSTNEILNIFEWDGTTELFAPPGTTIVPYISGSITQKPEDYQQIQYGGNFYKSISGKTDGILQGTVAKTLNTVGAVSSITHPVGIFTEPFAYRIQTGSFSGSKDDTYPVNKGFLCPFF